MSYHARTPRMVTPRLAPQPPPVVYATVGTAPYQPAGSHYPGQVFHVAPSEPGYSRGRHRSSSRSRDHKRSHSSGGRHHRHHRHHRRSSTPSHSIPSHYSPGNQYAVSRSFPCRSFGECRSNSKFSDYSLSSSPSSLGVCSTLS